MTTTVAELRAAGDLRLVREELSCQPDQLLIKIEACGICAADLEQFRLGPGSGVLRLGHEPVGRVLEVGARVNDFKVGDRITGFFAAACATYALASPSRVLKVPNDLPPEELLGEPLAAAVYAARACGHRFGDAIALVGCSFTGLMTLGALASKSAEALIAIDQEERLLSFAHDVGATHTINCKKLDARQQVMALTNGRGVELAIYAGARPHMLQLAGSLLRAPEARLALLAWQPGPQEIDLSLWKTGALVVNAHPDYSLHLMEDLRRGLSALSRGALPLPRLITHKFNLKEIDKAFRLASERKDGYVKGVIYPE